MKLRNLRAFAVATVGGMLLLATASNIYAVPTLSFSVDGGAAITCAMTNAACNLSTTPGVVMVSSAFNNFAVSVTTGATKPLLPGSQLDLSNVTITTSASGPHTLQIMFSETDFTKTGLGSGSFGGTLGSLFPNSPSTSTVSASAYFSSANTLFGLGTQIGTTGAIPANGAFSANFNGPGPSAGLFSLTQILTLTTTGPTVFSGDFALSVNPEPSSFVLMSSVLLFAAAAFRLRPRRS